ncbi:Hypothetical predicted protein [Olea europaea subsp. europaea]|uniref:Uncharacterized protein n=1 Tax=Olea europaea subsp. europaea TaxID=158383 RepID=A0A8S0PJI6_OLEEU|nr:Hypothetical predicted protein [Olea europaea subsp. europaea]
MRGEGGIRIGLQNGKRNCHHRVDAFITNPITPELALTFDIRNPPLNHTNQSTPPLPQTTSYSSQPNISAEFNSAELVRSGGGGDGSVASVGGGLGSKEPTRTLKRPRLVWIPQL